MVMKVTFFPFQESFALLLIHGPCPVSGSRSPGVHPRGNLQSAGPSKVEKKIQRPRAPF